MRTTADIKTYLPQIVWLFSGVILGTAAILSFTASGEKLLRIAPWLGCAMLITGVANAVLNFCCLQGTPGARWMLADSVTAALLSLFPLFNQMTPAAVIPFFFCVWDLFSGVLRLIESFEQREEGERGWRWFCVVGVLEILAGVSAMLKPVEEALTMHMVVGFVLLIQSAAFFHKAGTELRARALHHHAS